MSTTRRDYDPTELPLAFDGRDAPPARRGPAPVTLVLSLLLLVGLGGGVFYLYRGGVRAPSGPPAPVGVPIRDVRVAAPPQPQQPDPAAGLSIYKDSQTTTQAAPTFVAPPEQPTPRPVTGQEVLVAPTAGPIAAAPADVPQAKPVKTASIDSILATQPAAATAKPAIAASRAATATVKTASAKPPAAATVKTASATENTPTTSSANTAGSDKPDKVSGFVVQIGAFSSETMADKSWDGAAGVAPGAMAGKGKHIAPMSKDGATLYRVAITGFSTRADAQSLCAKLTAAGKTCFVR
jgi:cell division septation protein DedD